MIKIPTSTILDKMQETGVIPVFYDDDPAICNQVLSTAYKAGIRVFEFTNRGERALENFRQLAKVAEQLEGMILGIGTIFKKEDAVEFTDAGAHFVVSPALVDELADFGNENEVLWVPGCGSVTEIYTAKTRGAELVKVFPGNVLGAAFVKAVKAVMPNMKIMPTGGVSPTRENLASWYQAGVHCVGMGSQLFDPELIRTGTYDVLEKHLRDALRLVVEVKL